MFGKIAFINAIPRSTKFEVEYGLPQSCNGIYTAPNVKIFVKENFRDGSEKKPCISFYGSYEVSGKGDEIKTISIDNTKKEEIPENAYVDTLLVVIKFGWFETTAKRVAGRYSYDAVLEMHKGDTVTISKGMNYPKQTFEVIESGKELFLKIRES